MNRLSKINQPVAGFGMSTANVPAGVTFRTSEFPVINGANKTISCKGLFFENEAKANNVVDGQLKDKPVMLDAYANIGDIPMEGGRKARALSSVYVTVTASFADASEIDTLDKQYALIDAKIAADNGLETADVTPVV